MPGPIDDLTILDLTTYITGPYATKLLADYGANVIKVEPPGGDPSRRLGPFKDDIPGPERSGTFAYLNINKRSVVLDLKSEAGRAALAQLVRQADVVVESFSPGTLDRLGVGWEFIQAQKPDASLVSISNFGQDSPYRDYKGSELVLYGFAGEMYTMGIADREPVKMYGTAALVQSGAAVAPAILGAAMVGRMHGVGQQVDFSIADSHFGGGDRRHVSAIAYEFSGRRNVRSGGGGGGLLIGVYPCADGWVEFTGAAIRADRLADMLGYPEFMQTGKWTEPGTRYATDLAEEFNAFFYPWLYDHTKREIWAEARRAKVLCGPLFTIEEIFEDDHFRDRGFWQTVEHPELGTYEMPGRPFIMADSPWELRFPPPLLGQHTSEVLSEAGCAAALIDQVGGRSAVEVQ